MSFFYEDNPTPGPDDIPLAERLKQAGLLPGDEAWEPLLSVGSEFVSEWVGEIRVETPDDLVVLEAGFAQIRRLLPDMDDNDRAYLMVGMIVMQAWLYTFFTTFANSRQAGLLTPKDRLTLNFMEYKVTSLVTMLTQMGDDIDMSTFENLIKENPED